METPIENQESEKPVIIDPEEFGLTTKKAGEIEGTFSPLKTEYDALLKVYETIMNSEITSELCEKAKRCRIDAGKLIKGISDVHKVEKAVFWQGGLYVDAIKNRDTRLVEQIKTGSKKIEDHYLIIELKRIEKVRVQRTKELSRFTDQIPEELGAMRMEIYHNYLAGAKVIYKDMLRAKKKAEEDRIAAEKALVLHTERKEKILPYWGFVPVDQKDIDFSTLTQDEWKERFGSSVEQKEKYDADQERIKKENEKLRFEREEMDRLTKIEFEKREKIEAERIERELLEQEKRDKIEADRLEKEAKRDDELKPYIMFIRDYSKMLKLPEQEYRKELGETKEAAELHWKAELEKKEVQQAILYQEREQKEKIERQLKINEDAVKKRRKEEQDKIEFDLRKGDADKIKDLVGDLKQLQTKYLFKSKKNQAKYLGVIQLLSKVIAYTEE